VTGPPVDLYVTPGCPHCEAAREHLARLGVVYREHDVSRDPEALERMLLLSGRALVPTVRAGDEVLVGFDEARIDQMIGRLGRGEAGGEGQAAPGGETEA
jgi:glutaredoxin 3